MQVYFLSRPRMESSITLPFLARHGKAGIREARPLWIQFHLALAPLMQSLPVRRFLFDPECIEVTLHPLGTEGVCYAARSVTERSY